MRHVQYEHRKQYYEDNKEKILEKAKQYYQDNKDKFYEYSKQYYNYASAIDMIQSEMEEKIAGEEKKVH